MKNLLLALLALALLSTPHRSHADTVQGYVINPGTGARVPNISVAFLLSQGGQLNEVLRKNTDGEGRFSFSGPFITGSLSVVLVAHYQDMPFPSSELRVGGQQEIILEVYDAGGSADQISISTNQLFLVLGENGMEVTQAAQMENRGSQAFAGRGQGHERQVAEFSLPDGAFNLQSFSGHLDQTTDTQAFDTQPLPPGNTQIAFSFQIDPAQLDGEYRHRVLYPTAALEAFVFPATLAPEPPFADLGEIPIQGKTYRRMRAENLSVGQELHIPVPTPRALGWILKWVALGMAGLAVVAGALVVTRHPTPAAVPAAPAKQDRNTLEAQRRAALQELAQLDDTYQSRQHDPQYRTQRARLFDQALALYRLLDVQDAPR
ncbi:MAG: hypothetical protein IT369_16495 [Candidatus Latescibacteria bacterium]|nr:hypothetical protein [Candidatus Latescibacterota bacterium]